RTYDFGGVNSDEIAMENDRPDVDSPMTGYLWDNLAAHHVSYRDYGEFVSTMWCNPSSVKSGHAGVPHTRVSCGHPEIKKGENLPKRLGGGASPWPWAVPLF